MRPRTLLPAALLAVLAVSGLSALTPASSSASTPAPAEITDAPEGSSRWRIQPADTTTTTVEAPTTTTTVPPVEPPAPTTTTTAPPPPAPAAPQPAPAPVAVPAPPAPAPTPVPVTPPPAPKPAAPSRLEQVERVLDSSGFGWREAGVTVRLGNHPERPGHWGIYDFRDRTLWLGPGAFKSPVRLRYVALHELAHAWQWSSETNLKSAETDMARFGKTGRMPSIEAQADCVARIWGAASSHYWSCPGEALALTAKRLAGDFS